MCSPTRVLAAVPHVLLVLRVAWVSRLLGILLVHETKLRAGLVHLLTSQRVLDVVVCAVVNDLLIDLLLVVVLLIFVLVFITAVVDRFLMLAIQPWPSLVMSGPVEAIMCLCRALVSVPVGVEKVLVDVLVLVLVTSDVLLDIVLKARLEHVVLVDSDVLALPRALILREVLVVDVRL